MAQEQQNDWRWLVSTWDGLMADTQGAEWGSVVAELVQNVFADLKGGNCSARSEFMLAESERVWGGLPTLRVPGAG